MTEIGAKVIVTDNEMVPKELVFKFATKRFGMPSDKMQASLNAVHSRKFEKIEWDRLLKTQCWADVLELVEGYYR